MTNQGLVLVEFEYEYMGRDGAMVSIKPNERYILLSKTNDHWWHVRKDELAKPFYIPAKYVKELPSHLPSPLDFVEYMSPEPAQQKGDKRAPDTPDEKHQKVTIRLQSPPHAKKTENRMSTFGIPLDMHNQEFRRGGLPDSILGLHSQEQATKSTSGKNTSQNTKRQTLSVFFDYHPPTEDSPHFSPLPREPSFSPSDPVKRPTKAKAVEPVVVKSVKVAPQVQESVGKPSVPPELKESSSFHPKQPLDADNIYESILDVGLQNKESPVSGMVPVPFPAQSPPASAQTPSQAEDGIPSAAVFHNELKNNVLQTMVNSSNSSLETSPATSVTACSSPKEQLPVQEVPSTPSATTGPAGNAKLETDETTGHHRSHNPATGGAVWPAKLAESPGLPRAQDDVPPPLPEEDYPADSQDGWGPLVFPEDFQPTLPRATVDFNTLSGWRHAPDLYGKTALTGEATHEQLPVLPSQPKMGLTVEGAVLKNWRHSLCLPQFSGNLDDISFTSGPKRKTSDCTGEDAHHHTHILEKAGIVNKTKISENGKRLRKNWSLSWTVLHGGILTFHKDPKSTAAGAINKSNQIIPEYTVELRGATIGWATKEKSSKKNVLELKTRQGSEYLMQYDTDSIITDWYYTIMDTIQQLDIHNHSEEEEDEHGEKVPGHGDKDDKDKKKSYSRHSTSGSNTESEQGRVRNKLRRFLQRRPTLQSVKERGYIRENVFGCPLETLCSREKSTVPSFVNKCIKSVEKRVAAHVLGTGLDTDGIYRVSGNLAVIQKLRYKVDHEENLDLEDGQWEEIHVIAGALKLFFRELPEPLFPFSHFSKFIAAIKITDYSEKMSNICELVKSLPQPNHETMKVLFRHLHKVTQFGEKNRMSAQSVAIVFGPTLLRPEIESANITMYMIFQTQIVEFMLLETDKIFQA